MWFFANGRARTFKMAIHPMAPIKADTVDKFADIGCPGYDTGGMSTLHPFKLRNF